MNDAGKILVAALDAALVPEKNTRTDLVIAKLDTARLALMEARTIQQTKKIVDMAAAAEIYAKRQQLGDEAIGYATEIKMEALRQLGRMLETSERASNRPGPGRGKAGHSALPALSGTPPTLAELGLNKKTSALAQQINKLSDEQFEAVKRGVVTIHEAKRQQADSVRAGLREKMAEAGRAVKDDDRWKIFNADIKTWKSDRQYDFIITDPPYPKEFLPLYEDLAKRAGEWLKPNGLLIAMCGQSYLDEIIRMMSEHLDYYWTCAYLTPGQPTPLRQVNVNTTWKPLLMFTRHGQSYKGKIFGDVFKSDANDKDFHKWGQSISGMSDIVKKICLPGQWILDPFCGAATTGIAALRNECLFHGVELDEKNFNLGRKRLYDETKN